MFYFISFFHFIASEIPELDVHDNATVHFSNWLDTKVTLSDGTPLSDTIIFVNFTDGSNYDTYLTNATGSSICPVVYQIQTNEGKTTFNTLDLQPYREGYLISPFSINPADIEYSREPEITDNTIGYWSFDEGTGSTAYDIVNSNDGTISGASWVGVDYKTALQYDGSDDYVEVSDSDDFDVTDLSIDMWVKFNTIPTDTNYGLVYKDDQFALSFLGSSQNLKFALFGDASYGNKTSWNTNRWYHIVVTFDDANNTVKFYVDGKLDATDTGMNENLDPSSEVMHIGKSGFNGVIDEVFLYDKPLTSDEVNTSYDFYNQELSIVSVAYVNIAPTVNFISPSHGDAVGGKFFVNGTSFDSNSLQDITGIDYGVNVTKVEINIDNGTWKTVTGTTSWEWEWDAKATGAGNHSLNIRSFDGKKYSDVVSITVLVVIIDIEIEAVDCDCSVIPEVSANFTIDLQNYGSIFDYITLEATNLPSGWILSENNLTTRITKNSSKNVNISIIAPQYFPEGDYDITIKGTSSRDTRETSYANYTVTILRYHDFDVESSSNLSGLPRETIDVEFYITNQGNYVDKYYLEEYLDQQWDSTVASETGFVDPGDTISVIVTVVIPDKEYWQTTAQVQLNVTGGNYGTDDEFTKHNSTFVSVDLERRLSISVDAPIKYQLPGETIIYDFTIENIGNYQDSVLLENNSLNDDWSQDLSTYFLNLDYLGSKTFQLNVNIGVNAYVDDNFESLVTAISEDELDGEVDITVTTYALQYASVDLVTPSDVIEEPYRDVIFVFEIYNSGNGPDSFNIVGNSSGNWTFEMDKDITIELDRFETDYVEVIVSVPAGTPVGTIDTFTITVDSLFDSTIINSENAEISVKEGHGSLIEFVSGPEYLYPGEESSIKYKVINIGNVLDEIIIDNLVLPENWTANFSNNSLPFTVDLSAGEFAFIDLFVTPYSDYEYSRQAEYDLSIDSTSSKNLTRTTVNNFANEVGYVGTFDFNFSEGPYEALPGDTIDIDVYVSNVGNDEDTINLVIQASEGWSITYSTSIQLDYASSGDVNIMVEVPSNALAWDNLDLTMTFTSEKDSNVHYSFDTNIGVLQRADLSISTDTSYVGGIPSEFNDKTITITNDGNGMDIFYLNHLLTYVYQDSEISIAHPNQTISLMPGESQSLDVSYIFGDFNLYGSESAFDFCFQSDFDESVEDCISINFITELEISGNFPDQQTYSPIPQLNQGTDSTPLPIRLDYTGNHYISGELVIKEPDNYSDKFILGVSSDYAPLSTISNSMISVPINLEPFEPIGLSFTVISDSQFILTGNYDFQVEFFDYTGTLVNTTIVQVFVIQEYDFEYNIFDYSVDKESDSYTLLKGKENNYRLFMYPETKYAIPILITNNGNGMDTISFHSSQIPSEEWLYYFWDSKNILFSTNVSIESKETVTIFLEVDPPLNPKYNLSNYEFNIFSTSGWGNSYSVNITGQLLIPELEFTGQPYVSGRVVDGSPISATFEVSNTGYTPSGQFYIEFYDNGELVDTKKVSLEEGETKSVTGNWDLSIADTGEHQIEAKIKYGDEIVENDMSNNVASFAVDVSFNGAIWLPIGLMLFAYTVIISTLRATWSGRYNTVLDECNELNNKIILEQPLSMLAVAKNKAGIVGTLTALFQSRALINEAESLKDSIENKYKMVLDKRDELFNIVSMLKERGLDYTNAEETLNEVQKQLNSLRPENYSGLEMPDAEKYENNSISELAEIQEATVVEILDEEKKE